MAITEYPYAEMSQEQIDELARMELLCSRVNPCI